MLNPPSTTDDVLTACFCRGANFAPFFCGVATHTVCFCGRGGLGVVFGRRAQGAGVGAIKDDT